MSRQTNKNSLLIAGFITILALSIASTPAKGFGFVLGDRSEEQKVEEAEDRSDEKQESEDLDDQDEDEQESEDEEDENDDTMEIKSINVTKEGKTTKLNRQVELKNSGRSTTIKTKSSTGVEEEVQVEEKTEDDGEIKTEVQVETKNKKDEFKIKIRTGSQGFSIEDGKFTAKTNYPLSINSETNELTITTPAGSKVVAILPDQAIANMLRRGVLDVVGGNGGTSPSPSPSASPNTSPEPSSTPSASPTPEPVLEESQIEIVTTSQGEIAYKLSGGKLKKLFGFIPVRIDKNILVSADTGEVVSDQPVGIFDAFFDILSTN